MMTIITELTSNIKLTYTFTCKKCGNHNCYYIGAHNKWETRDGKLQICVRCMYIGPEEVERDPFGGWLAHDRVIWWIPETWNTK